MHWFDVMWFVVLATIMLVLFGTFTESNEIKIDNTIEKTDLQLEGETILLNYLRTPITKTDFITKDITYSPQLEIARTYALENDLTIADLFVLIDSDIVYEDLVKRITFHDEDFSKYEIAVDISGLSVLYKEKDYILLSKKRCSGKTSVTYIPVRNKNPIPVYIKPCP